MGARRAARVAGYTPKSTPMPMAMTIAATDDRQRQDDPGVGERRQDDGADDAEGDAEEPAGEAEDARPRRGTGGG